MRSYIATFALLVGFGSAYPQQIPKTPFPVDNSPISGEQWRLKLVEYLISLPSPVSFGAVQLHGMGDEAAADIVKLLGERPTRTSAELQSALDVIHMAFEQPASIIEPAHRKPMAALFLMQHLASSSDETVKERITKERKFLDALTVPPRPTPSASTSKQ